MVVIVPVVGTPASNQHQAFLLNLDSKVYGGIFCGSMIFNQEKVLSIIGSL